MNNLKKLQKYMKEKNIESFFVAKKENVRYISSYTGEDSFLVVTQGESYFLTDPRYSEQASKECPEFKVILWKTYGGLGECINSLVGKSCKSLAFESSHISYNMYASLKENLEVELLPTSEIIENLRIIKSEEEIRYIRAACDITCRAFERILKDIKVGVTEKELAAKLATYMVLEGADTQPYGNILISGARTSLLHGIPSSKAIEYGDFVLLDFGCQVNGYMSDMTRTVIVGKPTKKQKEVYDLTKQMIEISLDEMKAGAKLKDIYYTSINPIKDTQYLKYHYSGIGHCIGLSLHEAPFMGPNSTDILDVNSIRTIEPGIYIPDWGGVRIEDQILITENGYENLTWITHDLIEL